MEPVSAKMGDIFEGGADLTVLPCSAKGTFSSATRRWIEKYRITTPKDVQSHLRLGDVTTPIVFPGSHSTTKYISFAASVLNDSTSEEAIHAIGEKLGLITVSNFDIERVEAPLLGTGHGRLPNPIAGRALAAGFKQTRSPHATLWLFVYDYERFLILQKALRGGLWSRVIDSLSLRPGFLGIGIDLKKLLGLDK